MKLHIHLFMGERLVKSLFDCCCNRTSDRLRVLERVIESQGEEHNLTSGLVICLLRKAPIYSILLYILQSFAGLENAGYTLANRKATEGCMRPVWDLGNKPYTPVRNAPRPPGPKTYLPF